MDGARLRTFVSRRQSGPGEASAVSAASLALIATGELFVASAGAKAAAMPTNDPYVPEVSYVSTPRVACDGAAQIHAALGHPRVYLQIDERGFAECGYCDKRFILKGGPADEGGAAG
jgi:uncharacterized Zn-finger protein